MSTKNHSSATTQCPCGTTQTYVQCCGVFHASTQYAPTAQVLMRSRYSAYVMNDFAYLRVTWHPSTCPTDLGEHDDASVATKWLGLSVQKTWQGAQDDEAFVEFIAKYKIGGQRVERLHEVSRFVREDGRWFYVDGAFLSTPRQ
ncbi:MAG: hypothetical protein H6R05_1490 [Burkholderiaceae bacterium]|nr:hypothetical protein [Burkholderiaceae bacterium]